MEAISDAPKYGSLKEALIGIYGEEVWGRKLAFEISHSLTDGAG